MEKKEQEHHNSTTSAKNVNEWSDQIKREEISSKVIYRRVIGNKVFYEAKPLKIKPGNKAYGSDVK